MSARDVSCPWCYASAGNPCMLLQIGGHKKEVTYFHQARAVKAIEEARKVNEQAQEQ